MAPGSEGTINAFALPGGFIFVSRALLRALEARAVARGNQRCTLTSTETAHRFYQSAGYVDDGVPTGKFGTRSGYPMTKQIVSSQP